MRSNSSFVDRYFTPLVALYSLAMIGILGTLVMLSAGI
jgi:hypothetical protein